MKRKVILVINLIIINLFSQAISESNKIDWTKLPQLEGSGWGRGSIETKAEKIGNLKEFDYLLEDNFCKLLKKGISGVSGISKMDVNISSSSFLKEKNLSYDAEKTFDNDLKTAWCEGVKGFGFKEWLKFDVKFAVDKKNEMYRDGISIPFILIYPGFGMSEDLFYKNNRLKTVVLMVVSKKNYIIAKTKEKRQIKFTSAHRLIFEDINKYHLFRIEDPYTIADEFEIYLYIEDAYKGSKFDDTCISDIRFYYL